MAIRFPEVFIKAMPKHHVLQAECAATCGVPRWAGTNPGHNGRSGQNNPFRTDIR
jgi:hypothetical protein